MVIDKNVILNQNIQWHKTEAYFYNCTHPEDFNIFEQKRLRREIRAVLSRMRGKLPVLDLASGTGNLVSHIRRYGVEPIACDLSPEMLAENPAKEKILCDVTHMPFGDGYFGAMFSYSVFHHFPDPEAVMKEVIRVSAPQSILYFDHDFDLLDRKHRLGRYGFTLMDVFGWILWLLINPKHLKRLFEYFLWGRKKHLANIASLDNSEDPKRVNMRSLIGILEEAGFDVLVKKYGSGCYVKAVRGFGE